MVRVSRESESLSVQCLKQTKINAKRGIFELSFTAFCFSFSLALALDSCKYQHLCIFLDSNRMYFSQPRSLPESGIHHAARTHSGNYSRAIIVDAMFSQNVATVLPRQKTLLKANTKFKCMHLHFIEYFKKLSEGV